MPQIAYAHSVRDFIRELLKRFIPDKWIDRVISDQDVTFDEKLDAAFSRLDEKTASEKDYCAEVVSVLCDEVSSICEVMRLVCVNRGYRVYAETYLSTEKFIRLLLRQDTAKLERLNAAVQDAAKPLCLLLRDVGAILEDRTSDCRESFGAAEMKKANAELKAIAADVKKTLRTGFAEVKSGIADVGAKVDAVGKKASPRRAKCRGKYTSAQIEFCARVWDSAYGIQEIRNSTNTKVSYEAVFRFYRRQLAKLGIESVGQFKSVVRASQARARRELEANRGRSAATDRGKNGIIPAVKRHTKIALFTALAIVSAAVAPMRSDASVTVENSSQYNPRPAAYTVKAYTEG